MYINFTTLLIKHFEYIIIKMTKVEGVVNRT